ncbi:MAG: hypothetical protein HGA36_00560 [Candidatus Moranbacteria bacterium]|nr:hypothetical protein [Candidatus Moranbacteria bacterium]
MDLFMDIITTIECLMITAIVLYLLGIGAVWIYEFKKSALYRQMKQELELLERFNLSRAVIHAKSYRINENYRKNSLKLERVQQFILKNVLLIGSFNRLASAPNQK